MGEICGLSEGQEGTGLPFSGSCWPAPYDEATVQSAMKPCPGPGSGVGAHMPGIVSL